MYIMPFESKSIRTKQDLDYYPLKLALNRPNDRTPSFCARAKQLTIYQRVSTDPICSEMTKWFFSLHNFKKEKLFFLASLILQKVCMRWCCSNSYGGAHPNLFTPAPPL